MALMPFCCLTLLIILIWKKNITKVIIQIQKTQIAQYREIIIFINESLLVKAALTIQWLVRVNELRISQIFK